MPATALGPLISAAVALVVFAAGRSLDRRNARETSQGAMSVTERQSLDERTKLLLDRQDTEIGRLREDLSACERRCDELEANIEKLRAETRGIG